MAGDQVQEIKEKNDIVDLISQYLPLRKAGKNYKALCPFHNEKTPSFMVSPELQIFKCFGCGESGDVYGFLMKIEGMEFGEALRTLAQKTGVKLKSYRPSPEEDRKKRLLEINHLTSQFFHYLLTEHRVGKKALDYLKKERGFKDEIIKEFNLGYAPDSWDSLGRYLLSKKYTLSEIINSGLALPKERGRKFYDRFRGRVMFPLADHRGRVVGFSGRALKSGQEPKYINTPETPVFRKREFLYGLFQARQEIRKAGQAVVVEGETDFLTPYFLGTKNIVASKGTALTQEQIKLLKRYTGNIAICFDTDLAGDEAARRGINLAEKEGLNVSVVILPEKYKDPDECARTDFMAWEKAAASPVPVYDFYFEKALKEYDPREAVGKKKISQELLPVIKEIPNDIEREHYLQRLSQELEVGVEVLKNALSKIKSEAAREEGRGSLKIDLGEEKYPQKEAYALSLVLKAPQEAAKAVLHRLGKDDFSSEKLRDIFSELKRESKKARSKLSRIRDKIKDKETAQIFENLALYDWELSSEEIERELEKTLLKLKEAKIRRRLKDLARRIKRAEKEGREEELRNLQEEFKRLSHRLTGQARQR